MEELSVLEKDTIAEVGNISLGASATALSTILNKVVDITTPRLEVLALDQVQQTYPIPCIAVKVEYTAGLQGSNMLLIKEEDALIIAALMMGEPHEDKAGPLSEIELSAVQEAMNQMMGSMTTSMSELFQRPIDISPPEITLINLAEEKETLEEISDEDQVVQVEFTMKVEDIIDSVMVQVIPVAFARQMANDLLGGEPGTASVPDEEAAGPEVVPGGEDLAEEENVVEAVINTGQTDEEAILSDLEKDTIAEVGNISLGASATALSTILNTMVDITTPKLNIMKVDQIQEKYPLPCVLVEVDYTSGLEGRNILLIKQEDAAVIASMMMGESSEDKDRPLSEIELSAVQEAMNQMMGSMATSMSELFQRSIEISPPKMTLIDLTEDVTLLEGLKPDEDVVHVEFTMKVEDVIDSVMLQVIPIKFAKNMTSFLLSGGAAEPPTEIIEEVDDKGSNTPSIVGEVIAETEKQQPAAEPVQPEKEPDTYRLPPTADLQKLEMVKDIPMDIIVVLGSTRLPLGDLYSLNTGGIVDLNCNANDPVEIMANDRLLAKGEVVMINDQLGVRITEIQLEEVIDSYGIS